MGPLHEQVTRKRIVYVKKPASVSPAPRAGVVPRHERDPRRARGIFETGAGRHRQCAAELSGNLSGRAASMGDLAAAAHLSSLDYFGEVPWK